MVCVLAENSAG